MTGWPTAGLRRPDAPRRLGDAPDAPPLRGERCRRTCAGRAPTPFPRRQVLDPPYQTEWLADRIGVDAPVGAGAVQPGGTDGEGGPFRRIHVLDRHVEVDLLRVRRVRPARGRVLLHLLEHHR